MNIELDMILSRLEEEWDNVVYDVTVNKYISTSEEDIDLVINTNNKLGNAFYCVVNNIWDKNITIKNKYVEFIDIALVGVSCANDGLVTLSFTKF